MVTTKTGRKLCLSQGYTVADVSRSIVSVSQAEDSGNTCFFGAEGSGSGMAKREDVQVILKPGREFLPFDKENGLYTLQADPLVCSVEETVEGPEGAEAVGFGSRNRKQILHPEGSAFGPFV